MKLYINIIPIYNLIYCNALNTKIHSKYINKNNFSNKNIYIIINIFYVRYYNCLYNF